MESGLSGRSKLLIAAAILAILISVVLSAFETSITSSDRFKVRAKASKGSRTYKRISKLIDEYDRTISSILVLINISHASYAALSSFIISENFGSGSMAIGIGIIASGLLMFLIGEMLPKLIALSSKNAVLVASATICMPMLALIRPISDILHKTATGIIGLFTNEIGDENAISEDDIKSMTENAVKTGTLEAETKTLIEHALSFDDKTAASIMTDYASTIKIRISDHDNQPSGENSNDIRIGDTQDLINRLDSMRYTRYPVVDENDNLLGVLNTKIFLQNYFKSDRKANLESSLLPPRFISEQMKIDDCLKELSQNRTHLGFVIGENEKISGIITIEDIIEELIGEVDDEKTIKLKKKP